MLLIGVDYPELSADSPPLAGGCLDGTRIQRLRSES
jgi:hypothetical protein